MRKDVAAEKVQALIRAVEECEKAYELDRPDQAEMIIARDAAAVDLLMMFDQPYEELFALVKAQIPAVIERVVSDVSRQQKAAADIRNALQPLVTARDEIHGNRLPEHASDAVKLLDAGIARLRELAYALDGKQRP